MNSVHKIGKSLHGIHFHYEGCLWRTFVKNNSYDFSQQRMLQKSQFSL
jgi:hypothetical protein